MNNGISPFAQQTQQQPIQTQIQQQPIQQTNSLFILPSILQQTQQQPIQTQIQPSIFSNFSMSPSAFVRK